MAAVESHKDGAERFPTPEQVPEPVARLETPSDYHRLMFDGSKLPDKKIVGLLMCQRDPLLRVFRTKVYAARPATISAPPPQKGKGLKKKNTATAATGAGTGASAQSSASPSGTSTPAPAEAEREGKGHVVGAGGIKGVQQQAATGAGASAGKLWEVELLDTIVFPEGQPSDTGTMRLLDPNGGVKASFTIEGCMRKKLDSIHLVRVPEAQETLFDGLEGSEVELEVDWDRRTDHMTIHTSQHLLSAVLDTWELPTLSWSMTAYPSLDTPYIELPRGLTWAEAREVEDRCNALIAQDKRVWIEVSVQATEGDDGYEEGQKERESRGIPKDYQGGVIRHCCILNTDRNACCGTQLPHIGLCNHIHVLPPSTPSTSTTPSASATKLYFTAGPRAKRYLAEMSRTLSLATQGLNCSRANIVERVEASESQKRENSNGLTELRKEVAKWLIDKYAAASSESSTESAASHGTTQSVVLVNRTERATHDFDFLSTVSAGYLAALPPSAAAAADDALIILTSAPPETRPALLVIHSKSDALAKSTKEKLQAVLEGLGEKGRVRGGGARGKYMCKVEGKWGKHEDDAVKAFVAELRSRAIASPP